MKRRDLALHLLDRQVQDRDGRAVSNVDDLELTFPDNGPPYVSAILCGPQALAPRLGGLLGRWLQFWSEVLSREKTVEPGRIPIELVNGIGSAVTVTKARSTLGVHGNEDRAREYLIDRIPGAR